MALPMHELALVAVVQLLLLGVVGHRPPLQRRVPRSGVRGSRGDCDVGRVPSVRPGTVGLVVLPRAAVLFRSAGGPPEHPPLTAHLPLLPLALVDVAARPKLSSVAVLLPILPATLEVRGAFGVVGQLALAGPFPHKPSALVPRRAIGTYIHALPMTLPVQQLPLVAGAVRPRVLPLALDAGRDEGPLVRDPARPRVLRIRALEVLLSEVAFADDAAVRVVG
mmetsp:Transcript_81335/g.235851  ORF Transcript_81335/g.235851 Transcript_81335/m.235851 type:complete len:222 (+) Transcript_81335:836-1501(+)